MKNLIAFTSAIILIPSVLSCVCSLPTQNPELGSGEDEASSEESSRCFLLAENPYSEEITSRTFFAVDSEGRACFVPVDGYQFLHRLKEGEIENTFANLSAEFCPTWPKMRKCLLDHMNSDRCNDDDRTEVKGFKSVNDDVVLSELFCNPARATNFKNLLKDSIKEKLWECVVSDAVRDQSMKCLNKRHGLNAHFITDMAHLVGCITPGLKLCASDDAVKEAKLVELLKGLGRSIQETHRDFWN